MRRADDARRLDVGVLGVAPPDALACWGARATIRDGRWLIPHERQYIIGSEADREALASLMNGGVLAEVERLERNHHRLRTYPHGQVVKMIDRPELVVWTRYHDGSVYLTAYNREPMARTKRAARMAKRKVRS